MILRSLASLAVLGLLALNFMLPTSDMELRGTENLVRADFESNLALGGSLPPLELLAFDGRKVTNEDLKGHRVLRTFERSVDW